MHIKSVLDKPNESLIIERFGIKITRETIQHLELSDWMNDEEIDFYLDLLCEQRPNDCYAFLSAFACVCSESFLGNVN